MTKLSEQAGVMFPAIENELKQAVHHPLLIHPALVEMMAYHLGWGTPGAAGESSGKRVRPLLTCLAARACGGEWESALPAAAAVELIHNFSLIHDDIQDESRTRRGRETVWVKWGQPHAINAGDLMFSLGFASLERAKSFSAGETISKAQTILQQTCISLTIGQYLDMAFEQAVEASLEDYWQMIHGKTAALLGAAVELGALFGGADETRQLLYRQFGQKLGLAFQVWDDWLGIWGDPEKMGKSVSSDLASGKKTFPILYGLSCQGKFASRWKNEQGPGADIPRMVRLLEEDGVKEVTLKQAEVLTQDAMVALQALNAEGAADQCLEELANGLLKRQS